MATLGLRQHANPIPQANTAMELHDRWLLGPTSIAIGYGYCYRLLQCQDVFEVWIVAQCIQESLLNGARISEHVVDTIGKKLFNDCKAPSFTCHDSCSPQRSPIL